MWSQVCGKISMLVHKVTLKKKKIKTVKKNIKIQEGTFFQSYFLDTLGNFFHISETTLSKQFFQKK